MDDDVVRPNPLQWLRYLYTGRVPARNAGWVRYDATCRTWVLRHVVRFLVLIAPLVTMVLVLLPAPFYLRLMSSLAATLPMLLFYLAYAADSLEGRVQNAGYPPGEASRIREERSVRAQRAVAARNRERRAARLERRAG